MSGNGRGVERGGDGDDGSARRAIWNEDGRWRLTAAVDDEGGGRSMAAGHSMSATMADCCEAAQTQQSNEGGGGLTRMAKCNGDCNGAMGNGATEYDDDDDNDDGDGRRRRRSRR